MANIRIHYRSFAGGEISPSMLGRIDDTKYQTGAASLINFIVTPRGDLLNRSGFEFVTTAPEDTAPIALIPYAREVRYGDWFLLELCRSGNIRIIQKSSVLQHKTPVPYVANTVYNCGDVVTYNGRNYYRNSTQSVSGTQYPPTAGAHSPYWFIQPFNGDLTLSVHVSTNEAQIVESVNYAQYGTSLGLVSPQLQVPVNISFEPRGNQTVSSWGCELPVFSGFGYDVSPPRSLSVTASGNTNTKYKYRYKVTATKKPGFYGFGESAGTPAVEVAGNILEENAQNTLAWTAPIVNGTGTTYRVYRDEGGIFGYIGETTALSFIDNNLNPDLSRPISLYDSDMPSEGFNAIGYFEQRKVYGGTARNPQTIWASRPSLPDDFGYTIPTRDDNRIKIAMNSRSFGSIQHIIPMQELIVLTDSAEWRLAPLEGEVLTPFLSARPQSYVGSSNVYPIVHENRVLFCANRGGHLRELKFSRQDGGYVTGDLSLKASHLFDGYKITSMCMTKSPYPILFCTSNSGKLLGFTYVPEEEIAAWHTHETSGDFLECATIRENEEDVVYALIRRRPSTHPNGIVYLEAMKKRCIDTTKCLFMDSGLSLDGTNTDPAKTVTVTKTPVEGSADIITVTSNTPLFITGETSTDIGDCVVLLGTSPFPLKIERVVSTTSVIVSTPTPIPDSLLNVALNAFALARDQVTGLGHLEGLKVSIIADGAVHPNKTVTNASVKLERPCIHIMVGLSYEAKLVTLPMVIPQMEAAGQGRQKNVSKVWVRLFEGTSLWVGPSTDSLVEMKQRTTEPYGTPPRLMTGEYMVEIRPSWSNDGSVILLQKNPLPVNILSLTLHTAIGG